MTSIKTKYQQIMNAKVISFSGHKGKDLKSIKDIIKDHVENVICYAEDMVKLELKHTVPTSGSVDVDFNHSNNGNTWTRDTFCWWLSKSNNICFR